MVSEVPWRFRDTPAPERPLGAGAPVSLPERAGSSVSLAKAPVTTLDRNPSAAAPVAPTPRARLHCRDCLGIFVSRFCSRAVSSRQGSFSLSHKCYNTCSDVTLNKRTLSLCSPECAWRQFFTEENKDCALAMSTVHSRVRNVARHVHPHPGEGPLAFPHLTSAGRARETDPEGADTGPLKGTHAHTSSILGAEVPFNVSNPTGLAASHSRVVLTRAGGSRAA